MGIAALRNLPWVHTAFGQGGVVTPHCSGMGRDIEDERRTVCKRPDRGGGITRAVPSAGHARATPQAARQAVPAPASTTAAANPQPDSRRAARCALSHQLIELGNARYFGVTELCTRT